MPTVKIFLDSDEDEVCGRTLSAKETHELCQAACERAQQLTEIVKDPKDELDIRVKASLAHSAEVCGKLAEMLEG